MFPLPDGATLILYPTCVFSSPSRSACSFPEEPPPLSPFLDRVGDAPLLFLAGKSSPRVSPFPSSRAIGRGKAIAAAMEDARPGRVLVLASRLLSAVAVLHTPCQRRPGGSKQGRSLSGGAVFHNSPCGADLVPASSSPSPQLHVGSVVVSCQSAPRVASLRADRVLRA